MGRPSNDIRRPTDGQCWQAVLGRDRGSDGAFVTGVMSTGIYCRPSCPARHPLRKNVRFFVGPEQAEAAGLRPCKRCRPDELGRNEAAVKAALELLQTTEKQPSLDELAAMTGYSASHFQRLFTRLVGVSPAAYGRSLRAERASAALSDGAGVTDAIYEAGYNAPSRFYEISKERMGMTPSAWKNGGRGITIHWAVVDTSLGAMLVAATAQGVCRLAFGEGLDALANRFPYAELIEGSGEFAALFSRVIEAVEQPGVPHGIPIDAQGTAFQEAVWQQLRAIPPGETRSYAEIAAAIDNPRASRAVGQANGANPVAVLTPCHRVIAADGGIGGYAYGEDIKRTLLEREAAASSGNDDA